MYAKEFEDLLKEYLTDGIITSKERQVLLKKAQELGYNVDEVDLYIDAQQQKSDQAVEAAAVKKRGKVCPRCGASIQSMQLTCPECGYEFNNKQSNSSAQKLMEKLESLNVETNSVKSLMLGDVRAAENKAQVIQMFPIPNTKEDLIEFATFCLGNIKGERDLQLVSAWKGKAKQVSVKIRYLMKNDLDAMALADELDKSAESFWTKLKSFFKK